jgi:hypothetical protein
MEMLSWQAACQGCCLEANLMEITNGDKGKVEAMARVWNENLKSTLQPCVEE